jgi:short-subunit dehydrogenase
MKPIGVITGASSGIGRAFAAELASTHDLILVARRKDLLDEVSEGLKKYNNNVTVFVADLATEADLLRLEHFLALTRVDILVNAAGFGDPHPFHESSAELIHDMIFVHVVAATRLSRTVLSGMINREQGVIINVASVSGFSRVNAGNLIYNSTKAYLIRFSELLQQSNTLKNKVKIQVLCPGFTETGFFSEHQHNANIPSFMWMKAEEVVKRSLRRIRSHKTVFIPGFINNLVAGVIGSTILLPLLKLVNKY